MNLLRDVLEQGRRATAEVLSGGGIEHDSPHSPEVPEDLRQWLPDIFDRFPIVLPWDTDKPIDPALHAVWLLDNTAFRTPAPDDKRPQLAELTDANHTQPVIVPEAVGSREPAKSGSGWEVEYVACYFIKNSGKNVASIQAKIIHALNIGDDDLATKKRIIARLQPFVDTVLPKRTVRISINGREEQTLGPSSWSGISSGLHELHFEPPSVPFQSTVLNLPPPFGLPSITVLAEEQGWGVISDIDDTIKITQSCDPIGILKNTFTVETSQAIPGMPELYAQIDSILQKPAFFYLSASPYNLYPFLRRFRDAHFPQGTMILRDASWQNIGGLIASLNIGTQAYKVDRIQKIHAWLPHRKFICVGDSTQTDPEAYGEVMRKHPGWIKAVFIRKVTGIAHMDEAKQNGPERFEKAFEGVERQRWHVFTEPGELAERIDALSRDENALVGGA
nr:phosphatidate phosphatase app1 [Quercus suber]